MKRKRQTCPRCFTTNIEYTKREILVCNRCGYDSEMYDEDIHETYVSDEIEVTDQTTMQDEFVEIVEKIKKSEMDE